MTTEPSTGASAGLRERKKQRTRNALVRAALELFTTQGFEETTIDEITDAVEVSQRTFFRYFANKEEVAFAVQSAIEEHFFSAFAARPPGEPPITSLRRAVSDTWDVYGEPAADTVPPELHMRMYHVIESTPALFAVLMYRSTALEDRLVREIGRREGVDVATDPRPRVLVAAFGGVMQMTGRVWGTGRDNTAEALRRITEKHLDQIGPALAADWRRPA